MATRDVDEASSEAVDRDTDAHDRDQLAGPGGLAAHLDGGGPPGVQTLREWFAEVEVASLELPGGWFGRPRDNLHQLTWAESRSDKLIVELDDRLHLLISGVSGVEATGDRLQVVADHIVFDWQDYGPGGDRHTEIYRNGGKVVFHSP